MKRLLVLTLLLCTCLGSIGADINITNVTRAAAVPHGSYLLGTTGLVTRLLPVDTLYAYDGFTTNWIDGSFTFATSNAYNQKFAYTNGATENIIGTRSNGVTSASVMWGDGIKMLTNSQPGTLVVTLNGGQYDLQTNGAVAWVGVTGKSTTLYGSAAINVYATSGGPYLISAPPNCFLIGTPYFTNWTICSFNYNPTLNKTNLLCVPVY